MVLVFTLNARSHLFFWGWERACNEKSLGKVLNYKLPDSDTEWRVLNASPPTPRRCMLFADCKSIAACPRLRQYIRFIPCDSWVHYKMYGIGWIIQSSRMKLPLCRLGESVSPFDSVPFISDGYSRTWPYRELCKWVPLQIVFL